MLFFNRAQKPSIELVCQGETMDDQSRKDPEPVYHAERPMAGFWAMLTAEQKAKALAYRGPDNLGPSLQAEATRPSRASFRAKLLNARISHLSPTIWL